MSYIPIQTQIGNGAAVPSGLTPVTDPLYPPQALLFRLRSFSPEVYDLTPSSHLVRLMGVLLGDAGGEQLRKQGLVSRLRSSISSTHFLDMDAFWGALFSLNRANNEGMPYNPATGLSLNPYTDAAAPALWFAARQSDASYRSRIYQFANAISFGASPVGIKKVAEAILGVPVDLYETFQEDPAVYEATIVPHVIISQSDVYNLRNILNEIKPAHSIIQITQGIGSPYSVVTLAQAWASSSYWSVHAQITPGENSLYSEASTRPIFALSEYQGESWNLNASIRTIGSQAWDGASNVVASTDFEHYVWPDGSFTNFSPDLSVRPAWVADLGRIAQSGITQSNPVNIVPGSPLLVDGMDALALGNLLNNSSLVSQITPNQYWSTPARYGSDKTQEVASYTFDQPHYINEVYFEVANYPHHASLWLQDPSSGVWTQSYVYTNSASSPPIFADATNLLIKHEHPMHYTNDAWVPVKVRIPTSSVQNFKIILQRFAGNGPVDTSGSAAPYSLGVRNLTISNVIDDSSLLPVMGTSIDSSYNILGDQVSYEAYLEDPNNILNSKNSVFSVSLGAALTANTQVSSVSLENTVAGQVFLAGSYLVLGGQQIKVSADVTASGSSTTVYVYPFTPSVPHSVGETMTVVNPQWRSAPQASKNSVVNFYIDTRSSVGEAQVIDALYVEPLFSGVTANLYWSNSVPQGGSAADEYLPVSTTGTLTASAQGIQVSTSADGNGHYGSISLPQPKINGSWWVGTNFVATISSGTLGSFGPLVLSYSNNGATVSATINGIASSVTVGAIKVGAPNTLVVGLIGPDDISDLGSNGIGGLIYINLNGVSTTLSVAGAMPSVGWTIGSPSVSSSFIMKNLVIKGEILLSSTVTSFLSSPRSFCYKGEFFYQETGATDNAFIRLDPSFQIPAYPYGIVGGTPNGLSQIEWVPLAQNYILNNGYMLFPTISANFLKIEMTNLVPEPIGVYLPQVQTEVNLFGPGISVPGVGTSLYQGAAPVNTQNAIATQSGQPMFPNTQPVPSPEPDPRIPSGSLTLTADTPQTGQALASQFPSFGYIDWHQSPQMPTITTGGNESYITQTVNQLNQIGFFCGFVTIQALRSNIAAQIDTQVYAEKFLDTANYSL